MRLIMLFVYFLVNSSIFRWENNIRIDGSYSWFVTTKHIEVLPPPLPPDLNEILVGQRQPKNAGLINRHMDIGLYTITSTYQGWTTVNEICIDRISIPNDTRREGQNVFNIT